MNEYAAFRLIEEPKSLHLPYPITSQLTEKSDNAFLDSSGRLTTFEKPDLVFCLQDEGLKVEFKSNLSAFISSSTQSFYRSKQHKRTVIKG